MVFSRTLEAVDTSRTQLRTQFDPEEVAEIKAYAQGNVTIDGPTVAAQAIRHGLVDRIDMLVCPVVVGDGLRFLPDHRLDLDLQHEQRFDNGMVQLRYDVITSRESSA